jgi:cytochrome c
MKAKVLVLAVAGALAASASWMASANDVLKDKGCLNCHAVDKKKVGPSLNDIAAKYKGNAGAVGELTAKLKNGKGHMKVKGSDDEIEAAVKKALGQ